MINDTAAKLNTNGINAGCSPLNTFDDHKAERTPIENSGIPEIEFNPKSPLVK